MDWSAKRIYPNGISPLGGYIPKGMFFQRKSLAFLQGFAPQAGLFSNQFWDELRVYATLNYLIIQVVHNRGVVLILIVLAIL